MEPSSLLNNLTSNWPNGFKETLKLKILIDEHIQEVVKAPKSKKIQR